MTIGELLAAINKVLDSGTLTLNSEVELVVEHKNNRVTIADIESTDVVISYAGTDADGLRLHGRANG